MIVFADTNWLEALYFKPDPKDKNAISRSMVVERRMRRIPGALTVSQIVLIETRNVFGRTSGKSDPPEWNDLLSDFNGRVFVDAMNWDALRQETMKLFERFSHQISIGTFDAAIIASARLAGAREILSFDERLKAVSVCLGIDVFPKLALEGQTFLARLKSPV